MPNPAEESAIRRECHSERERGISGRAWSKPDTPRCRSGWQAIKAHPESVRLVEGPRDHLARHPAVVASRYV